MFPAVLVFALLAIAPRPAAAQASCPTTSYQTVGSSPPDSVVTLYAVDIEAGTLTPVGNDSEMNGVGNAGGFNAFGFNPADGFMYGFNNATDRLVRVATDGTAINVGPVQTALAAVAIIGGDIVDGRLYTYANAQQSMYVFDVGTGALLQTIATSAVIGGGDFAWLPQDGNLYAVNGTGAIRRIDPATGTVTNVPGVTLPAGNYGAAFADNQGALYVIDNSGPIYRINHLGDGSDVFYELVGNSIATTQNDGARCVNAPPSIALVKVVKSLVAESISSDGIAQSGEQLTYQFDLSNVGSTATSGGHAFFEVLPQLTTLVSISGGSIDCPLGSAGPRLCTITSNAAIAAAGSAVVSMVVEVDSTLPESQTQLTNLVRDSTGEPLPPGCSASNEACSTAPACDADNDPDHCVTVPLQQRPDLRIIKTASPGVVTSGTLVTYTLTLDNVGIAPVENAVVSDTPDAFQDCSGPASTASCTASNGASCPGGGTTGSVAIADLIGAGVTLPTVPVDGQVQLAFQCQVTASGMP